MASFGHTVNEIVRFHTDSPSNEIVLQQVREFIKILKKQLIKDWSVQSLSKAVRFGTLRSSQGELVSVQKRAARFVTLSNDLLQSKC